jgi:hypoxanthine phosphoribosyltransferase
MAHTLSQIFAGREPLVVGVLKGAFLFVADLVRAMEIPVRIDFVQAASYGSATTSSGQVRLVKDCTADISGQDIILVDTVVDTGLTLDFLHTQLRRRQPRSLTTCVLLDKPHRRQVEVHIDHVGFPPTEGFVVGYGLDFDDAYRHLDGLYLLDEV